MNEASQAVQGVIPYKHTQPVLLVVLATGLGFLCWGQPDTLWPLMVLSVFMPVLWLQARSRFTAGLVVAAYGLAASRGIPAGAAVYFDTGLFSGLLWWLSAGLLWFIAGFIGWVVRRRYRLGLMLVLCLLLVLPPAGWVGWAHPVIAAGWLFPGSGFIGLVLVVALILLLGLLKPVWLIVPGLLLVTAALVQHEPVKPVVGWTAIHTDGPTFEFGGTADTARNLMNEYQNMEQLQQRAGQGGGPVFLLPESVGGTWNKAGAADWQRWSVAHPERVVLLGAYVQQPGRYENVMVKIDQGNAVIVYRQRFPVPGVLWKPWEETHFSSQWSRGVSTINNQRVAFLICYENLMVWPVVLSLSEAPVILAVNGSVWWAPPSIVRAMQQSVTSWARLFDVALIEAWNR